MKKIILKCLIAIFGISLFQSCIKLPDISPNGENNISVHIINEDWGYRFDPNNPNEVLLDNVYVDLNNDDSDEIIIESISYYGPASIETTSGVLSELNNHYDVKKMSLGDLSGGTISGSKWVKKSSIAGGEYYIAVRVKLGVNNSNIMVGSKYNQLMVILALFWRLELQMKLENLLEWERSK